MELTEAKFLGGQLILTTADRDEARRFVYNFKPADFEITQKRKKRSLDANAFCWSLITQIAEVIHSDKDSVYLEMLKRYGQGGIVKIKSKDADMFKRSFKYWQVHESLPAEEKAQYYRFWVGSSNYNTKEMSALLDGIIDEAKMLDIEVIDDSEKALLLEKWGDGDKKD